jgi:hypothetical protein
MDHPDRNDNCASVESGNRDNRYGGADDIHKASFPSANKIAYEN